MTKAISNLVRTVVVLAFALGLPLVAIPNAGQHLRDALQRLAPASDQAAPLEYVSADRWRLPPAEPQPMMRSQSPPENDPLPPAARAVYLPIAREIGPRTATR